jgi:hypothetical protein
VKVTKGAPVKTRRLVARLMILAVFAMMLGQVAAMPSVSLSLIDQAALANQQPTPTQAALDQDEPGLPCQHSGGAEGPICCFAGDCPMLTLALPLASSAARPMMFRPLAYRHDAVPAPDGLSAAPTLPPPRHLA